MITSICQAKIPASCRYHGLGKNLPDEAYKTMAAKVDEALQQRKTFFNLSDIQDQKMLNDLENSYADSTWKNLLRVYNTDVKMEKFRQTLIPQPALTGTPKDAVIAQAVNIFNASSKKDFVSHTGWTVPFKSVTSSIHARNNCSRVSTMIVKGYTAEDLASEEPLQVVRVDAPDTKKPRLVWHHAAVRVVHQGQEYIVDYTIRQFNKKLPVPYVNTREEWMKQLNADTGEQWTQEHLGKWDVEGKETKESL